MANDEKREARLKKQLRANLRRRKDRARADSGVSEEAEAAEEPTETPSSG